MRLRFALVVLCCGALFGGTSADAGLKLPYKAEGLSKEQAAAYLLERFAFGARPGEVEKVAQMGPEKWLAQQLAGNLSDAALDKRLEAFPALENDSGKDGRSLFAKWPASQYDEERGDN